MKVSRTLALAKKEWKRIFREPAFLFIIILFPVMLTVAFGTSFGAVGGSQSQSFSVAVVALGGNTSSSAQLVYDLKATGIVNAVLYSDNHTAQSDLSQGRLQAVVLLPSSFDSSVQSFKSYPDAPGRWTNSTLSLYLDKGSMLASQVVPTLIGQTLSQGVLGARPVTQALPFSVSTPSLVSVQGQSMFDVFAPGLFAFASIYMIMTVAQSYTAERENGLLARILVTPTTGAEVIMGSVISYLAIGLIQGLLVFLSVYALGYHPVADMAGLLLGFFIITAFALCNIGFGLIAAAISRSAGAATGISFVFLMPQLFLGTFVGSSLSSTAQTAGRFLPAYYVTDALTSLFTRGASVMSQAVLIDAAVVSASSVVILLAGIQVFKKFGKVSM